ncbi:M3 family metallopeptidase [Hydromonas duriensis]|uniref:oligopeptidase A n=1 Tax=Hydromonas duriensis TaxID=1527608 RepID=A0A4R6YA69_9BURK|nr:M3 family metallopeptidase [Hydromonas duriensis]TDR32369.1 oligopeptidase A [Hydromonas duriensis]
MTTQNPLLDLSDLPRWADIQPQHVDEAMTQVLAQAHAALRQVEAIAPADVTWENGMVPLNDAMERLSRVWGVVSHCHHVMAAQWRDVYNEHLEAVTAFYTLLGQSEKLLAQNQMFATSPRWEALTPTRQHIVQNALRDFKLSGALLNEVEKTEFGQLRAKEAALQSKFSENVLDATNAYAYYADETQVMGIPADALAAMKAAAQKDGKEGYKITLQFPSYFPVMQYAEDRALRETIYRAYVTRASELGDAAFDNTNVIQDVLATRQRMAHLLGYPHYADVSLASKMAESVPQVTDFLYDLAHKAQVSAKTDMAALRNFASEQLGLHDVQAWDITYVSEKLREARYAFSEQEVKDYFPLPNVLNGLFHVVEQLFGVRFVQKQVQVWHPDVLFFELKNQADITIGAVYLDPYAREGKNSGAWMDEVRGRRALTMGALQTPVAHMVTNFTPPLEDKPSTLTHDDIITLFHETGHALHHLLTQVDDVEVSGIHGVEWDAVELPSQFMENFCWDFDVLTRMSAHVDTGAGLPHELFNKMLAAKNFQSGLQMLRQVEFSLYDILLHARFTAEAPHVVHELLEKIRAEIAVVQPPEFNRFQHSFSHIFAGGYSAGYYSYKWAEVLSADVFSAFETAQADKAPLLNRELGQKYWQNILAVGGSRPAMDSFKAFMGREPSVDALLRHSGLVA